MIKYILLTLLTALAAPLASEPPSLPIEQLLITPGPAQDAFVQGIANAKSSIHMEMYHLTNPKISNALVAAYQRGVEVKVILDQASLSEPRFRKLYQEMLQQSLPVRPSSTGFRISHAKSMVIDGQLAFITAINLTKDAFETRDFGVVIRNSEIAKEMESVFAVDWLNAAQGTHDTPPVQATNLVWSPINSQSKIVALIDSAQRSLIAETENLGDPEIMAALVRAAHRNIGVRLLVPLCDRNSDPLFNFHFIPDLLAGQVEVRVMPYPSAPQKPYMHSKMLVVDGSQIYIGSINFSRGSTLNARELGLIFKNVDAAKVITSSFEADWLASVAAVKPEPSFCP